MKKRFVKPRLEYEPESIEAMRARLPLAFEKVNRAVDVLAGKALAPSGERTNVFDFPNGLRLILSRDEVDGRNFIHLSASYRWASAFSSKEMFVASIRHAMDGLGLSLPLTELPHDVSPQGGIPHWMWHEDTHQSIHDVFGWRTWAERQNRRS